MVIPPQEDAPPEPQVQQNPPIPPPNAPPAAVPVGNAPPDQPAAVRNEPVAPREVLVPQQQQQPQGQPQQQERPPEPRAPDQQRQNVDESPRRADQPRVAPEVAPEPVLQYGEAPPQYAHIPLQQFQDATRVELNRIPEPVVQANAPQLVPERDVQHPQPDNTRPAAVTRYGRVVRPPQRY